MEISVIIPSYKPGEYLWECLESLNRQTLSKDRFETILILNGCNDPWKTKIESWIAAHPEMNINFIQTGTPGVSNARNIGLDVAKGEYIAFIDDDDYISGHYLEDMLDAIDRNSVVLTDSFAFFEEKKTEIIDEYAPHKAYLKYKDSQNYSLFKLRALFNGPCMKLIERVCISDIRFEQDLNVGEDSVFMYAISKNINQICFASPRALYYRRYRKNSAITVKRTNWFWFINCISMQIKTIKYWLRYPSKYNFVFTISRLLAPIKVLFRR